MSKKYLFIFLAGCIMSFNPAHKNTFAAYDDRASERHLMVDTQIEARRVTDARVLKAMRRVPRHLFVPGYLARDAYTDRPLPIGHDQTISQPYIVALMTETAAIAPKDKVLEIGTGSGYQAAVLALLAKEVFSIEIIPELAVSAGARLEKMGYDNVTVRHSDGYKGWPEEAPFDVILVTAAPPKIPEELIRQLKPGGRLVIPVGTHLQDLILVTKASDGSVREEKLIPVRFVPMVRSRE